ncbi:hypothetical protein [Ruminococcus sp.]|uniref:hypothetical protein n=1 Tax=Ruminococcus sp. TaxID=41978 RepID=UPI003AB8B1E2
MKKTISIIMALALAATLSTVVFAAEADDGNLKKNISVKAKYVEDIKASKTIQADVIWGKMEFTYSVNGTKTWNAKTHEYDIDTKGEWSAKGNDISVTNHSNAAIDVDFTYQPLDEYSVVKGTFTNDEFTIPTAEGKAVNDESLTVSTALTLSGELSSDVTALTKVGNVAVNIAEASENADTDVKTVSSYNDLVSTVAAGGKIKLDDDITLKSRINCKKNTVIELDLNGHTITGQIMNNGADCTIKNGTLNGDEGPIMVQGGTTNLIGCKISTKYTPVYVSRGTTNISSTIYKNPNSKYLPHVLAGTYNFDPTDFVDSEKFTITQSGENWIVAEKSQRR